MMTAEKVIAAVIVVIVIAGIAIAWRLVGIENAQYECKEEVVARCHEKEMAPADCQSLVCLECDLHCPGDTTIVF